MVIDWLRLGYVRLLTSGAQLLLLFIGIQVNTRHGWFLCLSAIALISVFAWLSTLYRVRAIRNTPRSTIASAAQGHVEVTGWGEPFCDPPLLSQLKRRPCLWCRYTVEERKGDEWRTVDSGETTSSFMLRDRTGECVIDPEKAEIITQHHERWVKEDERYTEWVLIKGDVLHIMGQFRTQGGGTEPFDTHTELNGLLTEWKQDMPRLLARFDLNRDGQLSLDEWEAVRREAMREVANIRRDVQLQPESHIISRPLDGQFFLISNISPERLSRRYLLWGWAHLLICFGSLVGLGWVRTH